MPRLHTQDGVELFYRDWGTGEPVVFVASWSMISDSWGYQMLPLVQEGYRCIAYDRRGHGRSDDPGEGYDYDTLADDLAAVLDRLDVSGATLVGHSMSNGEIVRYLTRQGAARVARIVMIGTVTPKLHQTHEHPEGIPPSFFEQFREQQLLRDFPKWIEDNARPFVAPETSPQMIDWVRSMCLRTSMQALHDCNVAVASTDFHDEIQRIDLPTLLLHGDQDVSCPLQPTAGATARLMPNARLKVYEGAPHGLFLTHIAQVNADLLHFIRST